MMPRFGGPGFAGGGAKGKLILKLGAYHSHIAWTMVRVGQPKGEQYTKYWKRDAESFVKH